MDVAILTIGTELTRGELVNTNAAWLSTRLTELGFDVVEHAVVADDKPKIVRAFHRLASEVGVVIVTGGLGPTTDDLTAECAAEALGVALVRDEDSLARIRERFVSLKRTMSVSNEKQADFPAGATVLVNPIGTAPGFFVTLGDARLFFTPGVPREMKKLFDEQIAPRIESHAKRDSYQIRIGTFGLPESVVGERLAGLEEANPGLVIGYRAHFPEVEVKVFVRAGDAAAAESRARSLADEVTRRLGDHAYGEGDGGLVAHVSELLVAKGLTLALAESCTGGLVGHLLTRPAGASRFLLAGAITYANEAKTEFANVPAELIAAHGAVSEPVARAMAEGIRARAKADFGVAITGVAGPGGGSPEKPVGTVFLAVASRSGTVVKPLLFVHDRPMIQTYAAYAALDLLRRTVAGLP